MVNNMAEIIKTLVRFSDISAETIFSPASGSDYIKLDNADTRLMLIIKNGNTKNVTVKLKAGNGTLKELGDIVIIAEGSKTIAVPFSRIESARVKLITGENKGKVLIETEADIGASLESLLMAVISVE